MTKSSEHNLPSTLELERSVQLFKAFGDQTRYKILSLLWQITSLIRTSPESFNGSLLMMYF